MSARISFRASIVPPMLAIIALVVYTLALFVDRAATHKVVMHCAHEGTWTCEVDEWRADFQLARRTVSGGGRITLRPADDGGGEVMLGDRPLAKLSPSELRLAYSQLRALDRPADEAVAFAATVTVERPFDSGSWLSGALRLSLAAATVLGLWTLRIMIDVFVAIWRRRGAWLPDPLATTIHREGRTLLVVTLVADHSKNF